MLSCFIVFFLCPSCALFTSLGGGKFLHLFFHGISMIDRLCFNDNKITLPSATSPPFVIAGTLKCPHKLMCWKFVSLFLGGGGNFRRWDPVVGGYSLGHTLKEDLGILVIFPDPSCPVHNEVSSLPHQAFLPCYSALPQAPKHPSQMTMDRKLR